MIDYPVHHETPITPSEISPTTISLIDALEMLSLEEYFKKLDSIALDREFVLPSGNTFMIVNEGIKLKRVGKNQPELWEISAKKTLAGHVHLKIDALKHTDEGLRLTVDIRKFIKLDTQCHVLPRTEMRDIFFNIEAGVFYTREGKKKADGSDYKIILEVKKKSP